MKRLIALGIVAVVGAVALRAQAPASPTFEVASVKVNKSDIGPIRLQSAGDRFTMTNVPLRNLIVLVYHIQNSQLLGEPDWVRSERFDIVAKAEENLPPLTPTGPPGPLEEMLRNLLAERFKLVIHHETREEPVYALVMAGRDRKAGPQLHESHVDCDAAIRAGALHQPPPPGQRPSCRLNVWPGWMVAGGVPIEQLRIVLSSLVQRTVIDRTGLTGLFEFDLSWAFDQLLPGPLPPGTPPIDPNGPSIFTALEEQLGLKLESQKNSVDVLVVDHVEHPTED